MEFNYLEKVQTLSTITHHFAKKKDIWYLSVFTSNVKLREDVRVVPPLPTLGVYPKSVVTFILPLAHVHAHLCIKPTPA